MNPEEISFSVVIPTYNRAKLVSRAIDSVINQPYKHVEIIVVDDGSSDNTREVITSLYSDKVKYIYQENSERGAARNNGVMHAQGNYIVFLDSDDILYPVFFKHAIESLTKYNQPGFLYMASEVVDETGKYLKRSPEITNDNIKTLIRGNSLGCQGIVIRRDVALENKFIESKKLFSGEDWELWLRIVSRHGLKCDNRISAALIHHTQRGMLQIDKEKLITTSDILLTHAFADEKVMEVFGRYKKIITAHWDTFIALHLVLANYKWSGLKWWLKGITRSPRALFTRRTLAVIKHFLYR